MQVSREKSGRCFFNSQLLQNPAAFYLHFHLLELLRLLQLFFLSGTRSEAASLQKFVLVLSTDSLYCPQAE